MTKTDISDAAFDHESAGIIAYLNSEHELAAAMRVVANDPVAHKKARRDSTVTAWGHAMECGRLLCKIKNVFSEQEFASWVTANCRFSMTTALAYLSRYEAQARLDEAVANEKSASVNVASMAFAWLFSHAKHSYEREILVALQDHDLFGFFDALVPQIQAAPPSWRWWLRPHPCLSRTMTDIWLGTVDDLNLRLHEIVRNRCETVISEHLDRYFADGNTIKRPNIIIVPSFISMHGETLRPMLEKMDVLLTLTSTASREAAGIGVPSFFLNEVLFRKQAILSTGGRLAATHVDGLRELFDQGHAKFVEFENLNAEIAALPGRGMLRASLDGNLLE